MFARRTLPIALLIVGGAAAFALSRAVAPIYGVRPEILLQPVSLLIPPGATVIALGGAWMFGLLWLLESVLYRWRLHLPWDTAFAESFRSSAPLSFLWVFALLLFPGFPGIPLIGWWFLIDGSSWILTLILAAAFYRKLSFVSRYRAETPWWRGKAGASASRFFFAILLLAVLFVLMPSRRFSEPYDERWGTGDEPRYVRIAASLLHDADADVSNAADHVDRRPDLLHLVSGVASWPAATLATLWDAVASLWSPSSEQASGLGGQVIRGKDGGIYYVYLPGLPLLLTPAMALDAFLFPGRLPLVILTCLIIGVLTAVAEARLVEPYVGGRLESYLLIAGLSLTLPLFFYNFQIFPEMTAALCLALMLTSLFEESLDRRNTLLFGLAASLLPWLHTRYYPVLGVCVLAWMYRARRDRVPGSLNAIALALPTFAVALQCIYIFHITGSLLPDALWVLNGYPRGGHLANPQVFSGLYYLLLGREEGLLVYAPLCLLAVPGVFTLWRQSRFRAVSSLAVFWIYLWISASHDQGGAGGWSPATRYLVPMTPILALWLASWLGTAGPRRLRWSAFFVVAAASFWIVQGMLVERNFPYDRSAFLSSGVLDVAATLSPALQADVWSTRALYPMLLASVMALLWLGERRPTKASFGAVALSVVALVLIVGTIAQLWIPGERWLGQRPRGEAARLRPERVELMELPSCTGRAPHLRFEGASGPHQLTVRGTGLERHLVVPSTGETEMEVETEPVRRVTSQGSEAIAVIRLRLDAGQTPIEVEPFCP